MTQHPTLTTHHSLLTTSTKVCVIGLDCVPPELVLERWRYDLPNLNRLMLQGVYGPLESCIPPITVPAWMCMMTGKDPGTLGIYGFRNRKDRSYEALAIANSRMIGVETVWDVLARHGKQSILLGVPLTYPPRPVNGFLVSDFLAPDTSVEYTYPPDLKREIGEIVGEYILDVRHFRTMDKEALLEQIYTMTAKRFQLARHLVSTKPWDFFIMVEMGPDRIHHGFWRYFDQAHPLYERGNRYENAIHDYYVALDHHVGEILQVLPQDTCVMVVSDHGAKRMEGGICLNEWLIREGYLTLKVPVCEVTKFSPALVDWERTVAWGDGGYYGRLFLNVRGREPQGILAPEDYEPLREELIQRLESLGDEQGHPIGTRVFRPQEVYSACNNISPDLIIYFGNLHWRSVGSVGHGTLWIHENDTGPDDANHSPFGMAIIFYPGHLGAGERREGMSIYDIAPTILHAFGIEPPAGMGRAAIAMPSMETVYTEEEEAEIARRLEELGYL